MLLAWASQLRFRFLLWGFGQTVGLAVGEAKLTRGELSNSFSGWSIQKVLISLQRYFTPKADSYVFSS